MIGPVFIPKPSYSILLSTLHPIAKSYLAQIASHAEVETPWYLKPMVYYKIQVLQYSILVTLRNTEYYFFVSIK